MFLDVELCFSVASPGELIEKEGIIEVKCPFLVEKWHHKKHLIKKNPHWIMNNFNSKKVTILFIFLYLQYQYQFVHIQYIPNMEPFTDEHNAIENNTNMVRMLADLNIYWCHRQVFGHAITIFQKLFKFFRVCIWHCVCELVMVPIPYFYVFQDFLL